MRYIIRAAWADLSDLAHYFGLGHALAATPLALAVFTVDTLATVGPYNPRFLHGNRVGRFVLGLGTIWSAFLAAGSL